MTLKALIFDLDGTLVDSRHDLHLAINYALLAKGVPGLSLSEVSANIGNGAKRLVEDCLRQSGQPADGPLADEVYRIFLNYYRDHCTENTLAYPGVRDTLKELEQLEYKLALHTNKPVDPTQRILVELGMERSFKAMLAGDSGPERKPSPNGTLWLLESLSVLASETVVIGDGVPDAEAARAAGTQFWAVDYGFSSRETLQKYRPEQWLGTFSDILQYLSAAKGSI